MLSITVHVWKAFASSVVRAMCAGIVHVCQRWRSLTLGSASYLGLCLVCTFGTPIAGMLAHSAPLPFVIDHKDIDGTLITEDEEGMVLALKQRDRVHCIASVYLFRSYRSSSWALRGNIRSRNT